MPTVIHLASRQAGRNPQATAPTPEITRTSHKVEHVVDIDSALALELYNIRQNEAPNNIHAAAVRAVQAAAVRQQALNAHKNAPEWLTPQRQAVIENALTMALHFVRQPGALPANVWAATSRATRAATLLKQVCGEAVLATGSAS